MAPYTVVAGGANLDIHSRLDRPVRLRDSNPGRVSFSAGGVGRNIAENLARLGVSVKLFSAIGGDAFGESILGSCREAGVDVSHVYRATESVSSLYLDITDDKGDMYLASSDMRVLDTLPGSYFADAAPVLRDAAYVIADGNLSPEQLKSLILAKGDVPLLVDPVSTVKTERFIPLLGKLFCIKPNRMELEVLSGLPCPDDASVVRASKAVLNKGCRSVLVSLGAKGCYYADAAGKSFFRSVPPVIPVNTTGGGDAFIAGFTAAMLRGLSPEEAARIALKCGILTVSSPETISPSVSPAVFTD